MKEETKTNLPSVEDIISDKEITKLYSIEKLKHLESENLQLREALEKIKQRHSRLDSIPPQKVHWESVAFAMNKIAEEALKKTT